MRNLTLLIALAIALPVSAAQVDQAGAGSGTGSGSGSAGAASSSQPAPATAQTKVEAPRPPGTLRTRSNVKIDLTISDQTGSGPIEKKQVTLLATEETWGKIRTAAATKSTDVTAGPVTPVRLNVDARPFLTASGAIQLELTIDYNPIGGFTKESSQLRPTEINQSMTVVLQSGKPVVVSQAADPVTDRKVIVEVVATILK